MLKLKNATLNGQDVYRATYTLQHHTPGRAGTVLELLVSVHQDGPNQPVCAELALEAKGVSQDLALDQLAERLERAADALRTRGAGRALLADYAGAGSV